MTFEQRPLGGEEVSPVDIWEKAEAAEGARPRGRSVFEEAGGAGIQQGL